MKEATVGQANEAAEIATLACDYQSRAAAIHYGISSIEEANAVFFSDLLVAYIKRQTP